MLFRKYASPFSFLDSCIAMGALNESVVKVFEKENEDKLWQMYLQTDLSKSFNKFKEEFTAQKEVGMTHEEVVEEVMKAEDLLKTFHL